MTTKKKTFITLGLLLSTLAFPWSFAFFILIIPPIYVGFVVPFLIWKFIFNGNLQDITKYSLIWKIPLIVIFNLILTLGEILTLVVLAYLPKNVLLSVLVIALLILILRTVAYVAIIWVWQPKVFKPFPKIKWGIIAVIFVIMIFAGRWVYLMNIAPESSDYDSYQMACLEDENCVIPLAVQQEIDTSMNALKKFWNTHSLW